MGAARGWVLGDSSLPLYLMVVDRRVFGGVVIKRAAGSAFRFAGGGGAWGEGGGKTLQKKTCRRRRTQKRLDHTLPRIAPAFRPHSPGTLPAVLPGPACAHSRPPSAAPFPSRVSPPPRPAHMRAAHAALAAVLLALAGGAVAKPGDKGACVVWREEDGRRTASSLHHPFQPPPFSQTTLPAPRRLDRQVRSCGGCVRPLPWL